MTTPIQGLPADPAALRAALAEHDIREAEAAAMAQPPEEKAAAMERAFELRNPRLVDHFAVYDLYIDGVLVLGGVEYITAYNYAADNIADADTYNEQEAAHRTRTLTGAELRTSREEIRRADLMP